MTSRFVRRRDDLSTPRRGRSFGVHYDTEQFGRFSEAIARFLGTARFLVMQTVIVALWIGVNLAYGLNVGDVRHSGWDPYPFILLNLVFSTQAAYAAPLILLAQNRQADRDRAQVESDREISARTQADTEYLARELAGLRLTLSDVATVQELRDLTEKLSGSLERLDERLAALDQRAPTLAADSHESHKNRPHPAP